MSVKRLFLRASPKGNWLDVPDQTLTSASKSAGLSTGKTPSAVSCSQRRSASIEPGGDCSKQPSAPLAAGTLGLAITGSLDHEPSAHRWQPNSSAAPSKASSGIPLPVQSVVFAPSLPFCCACCLCFASHSFPCRSFPDARCIPLVVSLCALTVVIVNVIAVLCLCQ